MPGRISSVVSGAPPRFGVMVDALNGIASPTIARPFTIDCADPPTGPNKITSYFDRRSVIVFNF